jgi:hypothetical protein
MLPAARPTDGRSPLFVWSRSGFGRAETIADVTAYAISEVEVLDESQGQRYRELAATSITRHGGRYLVRGAQPVGGGRALGVVNLGLTVRESSTYG